MPTKAVEFSLSCGGKNLTAKTIAVTVLRELGRIPFMRATLSLAEGEKPAGFKPGAEVELEAGYGGKLAPVFKGVLTGFSLSIRSGETLLELEARDRAYILTLGQKTALFLDKSDAEICKAILKQAGLKAEIPDTSPTHAQFQQIMTSDWDFLLSRLWANALVPRVEDGKIIALKAAQLGANNLLELDAEKDEILELEVRQENRSWLASVTARCWDEASQSEQARPAPDTMPRLAGSGPGNCAVKQELLLPHGVEQKELEALGEGLLLRARHGFACGRLRLPVLNAAQPGDGLKLKNVGEPADGQAVIWASRLELRPGSCTQDLQFGCDFPAGFAEGAGSGPGGGQSGKNGLSGWLSGNLPQAGGLYPAKVMKLSEDPDNAERIQVHIPLLHKKGEGVWARWAAPYAGKGYGLVFRPEPDDEVLVGFLGGDPRAPVILGSLPSKAAPAPAPLKAADEKNKLKGWVSKSGLTLLLDEEAKSVTVKTPDGQSVIISDKEGSIILNDNNKNTVTLDKNGVSVKSGKDIVLDAAGNVKISAKQNFSAEGLDASVQGKKAIKLGGQATGELKAGGPLTVKGAIVQIN